MQQLAAPSEQACETSDSELSCLVNFPLPSTHSNRKSMAYLPLLKTNTNFLY